jgi:hypothetical protein
MVSEANHLATEGEVSHVRSPDSSLHRKGATSCFFSKHFWLRPQAALRSE